MVDRKIYLWASEVDRVWMRKYFDQLLVKSASNIELVVVDVTRRDLLNADASGPNDVLIAMPQENPASDVPLLATPDAIRRDAQEAILAIELARQVFKTIVLARTDAERWPDLITEALQTDFAKLSSPFVNDTGANDVPNLSSSSLILRYLMPLQRAVVAPKSIAVVWPRECFLDGDAPGQVLPAAIELAGRARILAYGPYMPLPKGGWQATACLGFSPDVGRMPFILEVDTDIGITRGFFEVMQGGIFSVTFDFRVTDAFHPVEFRLVSQDSALEGLVSLIEIRLEQL